MSVASLRIISTVSPCTKQCRCTSSAGADSELRSDNKPPCCWLQFASALLTMFLNPEVICAAVRLVAWQAAMSTWFCVILWYSRATVSNCSRWKCGAPFLDSSDDQRYSESDSVNFEENSDRSFLHPIEQFLELLAELDGLAFTCSRKNLYELSILQIFVLFVSIDWQRIVCVSQQNELHVGLVTCGKLESGLRTRPSVRSVVEEHLGFTSIGEEGEEEVSSAQMWNTKMWFTMSSSLETFPANAERQTCSENKCNCARKMCCKLARTVHALKKNIQASVQSFTTLSDREGLLRLIAPFVANSAHDVS